MYYRNDQVTCRKSGKCHGIIKIQEFNQNTVIWRVTCDWHKSHPMPEGVWSNEIRKLGKAA